MRKQVHRRCPIATLVPMPAAAGAPLDQARAAFDWLTCGPHPVTVDGRVVAGMPARPVRLDELRDRLQDRRCPAVTRDAVWALLVHRARVDAGVWTIACVGCALPTLVGISRQLCRGLAPTPDAAHTGHARRRPVAGVPDHPDSTGLDSDSEHPQGGPGAPAAALARDRWRGTSRRGMTTALVVGDVEAAMLSGFLGRARGARPDPTPGVGAAAVRRARGRGAGQTGDGARAAAARAAVHLVCAAAAGAAPRSGAGPRGRGRGDHPQRGRVDRLDPAGTDQPGRGRGAARPVLPRRPRRPDPRRTQTQRVPARAGHRPDRPFLSRTTTPRSPTAPDPAPASPTAAPTVATATPTTTAAAAAAARFPGGPQTQPPHRRPDAPSRFPPPIPRCDAAPGSHPGRGDGPLPATRPDHAAAGAAADDGAASRPTAPGPRGDPWAGPGCVAQYRPHWRGRRRRHPVGHTARIRERPRPCGATAGPGTSGGRAQPGSRRDPAQTDGTGAFRRRGGARPRHHPRGGRGGG